MKINIRCWDNMAPFPSNSLSKENEVTPVHGGDENPQKMLQPPKRAWGGGNKYLEGSIFLDAASGRAAVGWVMWGAGGEYGGWGGQGADVRFPQGGRRH